MFGKILKELRIEKGYTQMKLASKLGISRSAVSMWEIGESEPDSAVLCKIAELFDVSTDYLLGVSKQISYKNVSKTNMIKTFAFGDRLKYLRKEYGLSQKALADKVFVSQQTVAKWETNKTTPNPETIILITNVLGITSDYLLGITDKTIGNLKSQKNTPKEYDIDTTFSNILKSLRKQHKMTQEKLARILRVEPSSISKYESANVIPSVDTLEKIADIFDVSLDFLLGRPEKEMQNINEENHLNSAEDELIKSYRRLNDDDKAVCYYMNRIRELRKKKGITQIDLAKKLGITQATLSGWETNKYEPDNKSLILLAELFDVSLDCLVGRPERETPKNKNEIELSPAENDVIMSYRLLDDEDKAEVKGYINGLLRSNKNIYTKEATG